MSMFSEEYGAEVRRQIAPIWWLTTRRAVGRPWKRNKWQGYGR